MLMVVGEGKSEDEGQKKGQRILINRFINLLSHAAQVDNTNKNTARPAVFFVSRFASI